MSSQGDTQLSTRRDGCFSWNLKNYCFTVSSMHWRSIATCAAALELPPRTKAAERGARGWSYPLPIPQINPIPNGISSKMMNALIKHSVSNILCRNRPSCLFYIWNVSRMHSYQQSFTKAILLKDMPFKV